MDGCTTLVGQSWPKSSGLTFKEDQVVRGHMCKSNYTSGVSFKAQLQENIRWEMLNVEDVVVSLEQMAVLPSVDDFICISQKCRKGSKLAHAKHLHVHVCQNGLEAHGVLGNYLVPMFVECGSMSDARKIFDRLALRNENSWTCLIQGYIGCGDIQLGLDLYQKMQEAAVHPSRYTFVTLLKACAMLKSIKRGQGLHAGIVNEGYESDVFLASSLVDLYVNCGLLAEAREVFDNLPVRDVVPWSTLSTGYTENMLDEEALNCLEQMQIELVSPNAVTYLCILNACSGTVAIERGYKVHAEIAKVASEMDSSIGNVLVDLYAKRGSLAEACKMFEKLPVPDVVSWNALITGYAEHGLGQEALHFLEQMQLQGVWPNSVTYICGLKICSSLGSISRAKQIHTEIVQKGMDTDLFASNTLVAMYAKCGLLEEAREMFKELPLQDIISWTALITGCADHGYGEQASSCCEEMQGEGVSPDSVTFTCIWKASGALENVEKHLECHRNQVGLQVHVNHRLRVPYTVSWIVLLMGYADEQGEGEFVVQKYDGSLRLVFDPGGGHAHDI